MTRSPSILYLVSRFPNVPETFVVNEWWRMAERFHMELGSLIRMRDETVHPQSALLLPQVHFAPLLAWPTLSANARWLVRDPRRYLRTLRRVVAASFRRPNGGVAKGLVAFWKGARFAAIVEDRGITHVHAHFISHSATAAWVVRELTGVPFSVTAHANDLFVRPALLEEKVTAAEFVATISEYNRTFIRAAIPGARDVELVHCGVDTDLFAFHRRPSCRRLICVARLESTKGHADLLRALAIARQTFPDLRLELIGDGADRAGLERLVRELRLEDRVEFRGALPTDQVRVALDDADLFVLPSLRDPSGRMDGIPVALMEAMASGLPVVATRLSGIPELVLHEETGLLVSPEAPAELAAAICRLAADPVFAGELAERARERVRLQFDLETEADRLARLFSRSAADSRSRQEELVA